MEKSEDSGRNPHHIAIFHMVSILAGVAQLVGRVQHSEQYLKYYHTGSLVKTRDLSHYLTNDSKIVLETKTVKKRPAGNAGISTFKGNKE